MSDVSTAPAHAAKGINGIMDKKVGPLPLPVVIGLGGGLLFYLYKKRQGTSTAATSTDTTAADGTDPATPAPDTSGSGSGAVDSSAPGDSEIGVPAPAGITTNAQWGTAAEVYLMAQGYSPALVDQAVRLYVVNGILDTQEQAVINAALKVIGPLPVDTGPVNEAPPAAVKTPTPVVTPAKPVAKAPVIQVPKLGGGHSPTPPAPAPKAKTYTVKHGDSLESIAKAEYGNGADWPAIYNANTKTIANPRVIHAGQVIVIPAKG